MATETAVHCICAREDVEVDEQTGRCLRCGKPAREAFLTGAVRDRNNGAGPRSPSQAYRSRVDVLKQATAPFDASRSVAAVAPSTPPDPKPEPEPDDLDLQAEPEELPPAALQPATGPAPAPEPGRPDRAWMEATRALADGFLRRADLEDVAAADARATAAAHTVEATRLRKRAALFTQLLQAIGTDVEPEPELSNAAAEHSANIPTAAHPTGRWWSRNSAVQVDACIDCGRADIPHCANGRCRVCDGRWRCAGQPKKAAAS